MLAKTGSSSGALMRNKPMANQTALTVAITKHPTQMRSRRVRTLRAALCARAANSLKVKDERGRGSSCVASKLCSSRSLVTRGRPPSRVSLWRPLRRKLIRTHYNKFVESYNVF